MASHEGFDAGELWRADPVDAAAPDLDAVRRQAARFERTVRWRNQREYLALAVVAIVFAAYIAWLPAPLMRAGSALVIAGCALVAALLHRRASIDPVPAQLPHARYLEGQRANLLRQQVALRSAATWYVAPFVPGLALFIAGLWRAVPAGQHGPLVVVAVLLAAALAGVAWLNRRAARGLQAAIGRLDAALHGLEAGAG